MKDDIKEIISDMREYLNDVIHKECRYNIYLDLWDMLDKLESTIEINETKPSSLS